MGNNENNIKLIVDINKTESLAIDQLKNLLKLKGVKKVVGLPDLHPGKGVPIGAVTETENIIYPHLVGNDIGCGISLFKIDKKLNKLKIDKILKRLKSENWYDEKLDYDDLIINIKNRDFDKKLGTIGKGNHFVELQKIDKIIDEELFKKFNLDKKVGYLMVHSGSRGYGEYILDKYIRNYLAQKGLIANSKEGISYLKEHNDAINWGKINRELIADRFLNISKIKVQKVKLLDSVHNFLEEKNGRYLHRKGAANSCEKLLVIPGSRGSYSYIVKPIEDKSSLYSIAHGAGRKWQRSSCKSKLENRYKKDDLLTTKLNSKVVCFNKQLLFEEAPEAYKDIKLVIKTLKEAGIIKVIAVLKPLITYKN